MWLWVKIEDGWVPQTRLNFTYESCVFPHQVRVSRFCVRPLLLHLPSFPAPCPTGPRRKVYAVLNISGLLQRECLEWARSWPIGACSRHRSLWSAFPFSGDVYSIHMSEDMSEDMPRYMSEHMSEFYSEYTPGWSRMYFCVTMFVSGNHSVQRLRWAAWPQDGWWYDWKTMENGNAHFGEESREVLLWLRVFHPTSIDYLDFFWGSDSLALSIPPLCPGQFGTLKHVKHSCLGHLILPVYLPDFQRKSRRISRSARSSRSTPLDISMALLYSSCPCPEQFLLYIHLHTSTYTCNYIIITYIFIIYLHAIIDKMQEYLLLAMEPAPLCQ